MKANAEGEIGTDAFMHRRVLEGGAAGWLLLAGLGVSYVIAGHFSAWNFGLAKGGWGGMMIALGIVAILYVALMLTLAELATILPTAGGGYGFARKAFGKEAGFLTGIAILMEYGAAASVVSIFIGAYFQSMTGFGGWPVYLAAYLVFVGIHLLGAGEALRVLFLMTACAIAGLLLFAVEMAPHFAIAHLFNITPGTSLGASPFLPFGFMGIWAAIPFATAFLLAVEGVPMAAEEAENPTRNLPRAMAAAASVLLVFGLIMLISGPGGAGADQIKEANDPLMAALAAAGVHAPWIVWFVNLAGLIGLCACLFSAIFAYSRQCFALSRAGYLPAWLSITSRRRVPAAAVIVPGGVGFLAALSGAAEGIFVVMVFCAVVSYILMIAAHIRLRIAAPELPRAYRTPGGIWTALAALALSLLLLTACAVSNLAWSLVACAILAGSLIFFIIFRRNCLVASAPEEEFAALARASADLA